MALLYSTNAMPAKGQYKHHNVRCLIAECLSDREYGRPYCGKHTSRIRIHGDPHKERTVRLCSVEKCIKKHFGNGLCKNHYRRFKKGQPMDYMAHLPGKTREERFWNGVKKGGDDECWPWQKMVNGDGYGAKRWKERRMEMAHRIAYWLTKGELPEGKPCVLHSCDNPPCCNPRHLYAGTKGENNHERHRKGRSSNGKIKERNRVLLIVDNLVKNATLRHQLQGAILAD